MEINILSVLPELAAYESIFDTNEIKSENYALDYSFFESCFKNYYNLLYLSELYRYFQYDGFTGWEKQSQKTDALNNYDIPDNSIFYLFNKYEDIQNKYKIEKNLFFIDKGNIVSVEKNTLNLSKNSLSDYLLRYVSEKMHTEEILKNISADLSYKIKDNKKYYSNNNLNNTEYNQNKILNLYFAQTDLNKNMEYTFFNSSDRNDIKNINYLYNKFNDDDLNQNAVWNVFKDIYKSKESIYQNNLNEFNNIFNENDKAYKFSDREILNYRNNINYLITPNQTLNNAKNKDIDVYNYYGNQHLNQLYYSSKIFDKIFPKTYYFYNKNGDLNKFEIQENFNKRDILDESIIQENFNKQAYLNEFETLKNNVMNSNYYENNDNSYINNFLSLYDENNLYYNDANTDFKSFFQTMDTDYFFEDIPEYETNEKYYDQSINTENIKKNQGCEEISGEINKMLKIMLTAEK